NPHSTRGTGVPYDSRVPSLEAFGRRPRCLPHPRDGPTSETLHRSCRNQFGKAGDTRRSGTPHGNMLADHKCAACATCHDNRAAIRVQPVDNSSAILTTWNVVCVSGRVVSCLGELLFWGVPCWWAAAE